MPLFLPPTRRHTVAIGICDRCKSKFYLDELRVDGDNVGLRVCKSCWDQKDRYKLAPRTTEDISLKFVRLDTSLALDYLLDQNGSAVLNETGEGLEAE
jgi:hypothetical protein